MSQKDTDFRFSQKREPVGLRGLLEPPDKTAMYEIVQAYLRAMKILLTMVNLQSNVG